MDLVELKSADGRKVYVNPARIAWVQPSTRSEYETRPGEPQTRVWFSANEETSDYIVIDAEVGEVLAALVSA